MLPDQAHDPDIAIRYFGFGGWISYPSLSLANSQVIVLKLLLIILEQLQPVLICEIFRATLLELERQR